MKIKNDILINILNILRNNHNSAIVLTTTKRKCNLQIYSRNIWQKNAEHNNFVKFPKFRTLVNNN